MDESSPPPPRETRFRFSLGTLFLITTCVAIFFGGSRSVDPWRGGFLIAANLVYFFLLFWFTFVRRKALPGTMIVTWIVVWAVVMTAMMMLMPA